MSSAGSATGNSMPAIQASRVRKSYDPSSPPVLQDFELTVNQGEFFGLLGPNGAGKTTVLSILCGTLKPDSGEVSILGKSYAQARQIIQQQVSIVPQEVALYERLSAEENLRFFGKLYGMHGELLQLRVKFCLEIAQLDDRRRQPVASFSGGMKRRLNLAISFLNEPRIIFLDEPTVGIDTQSRHLIHQQLLELHHAGTTLLYTTHYMEEAQELCSRVAVFDQGQILQQGSPDRLLRESEYHNLEELFLGLTGKRIRDQ